MEQKILTVSFGILAASLEKGYPFVGAQICDIHREPMCVSAVFLILVKKRLQTHGGETLKDELASREPCWPPRLPRRAWHPGHPG